MVNAILVRYGDLTLKGKNKKQFVDRVLSLIEERLGQLDVEIKSYHDRLTIILNDVSAHTIIEHLKSVSGLYGFSPAVRVEKDIEIITQTAIDFWKSQATQHQTFKVETKRSDKQFPMKSIEFSQHVAAQVLKHNQDLIADVNNPDITLQIDIRQDAAYIYTEKILGLGGFPVGVAGKGLLMISGGIDSPVAGFLAMKQGVEIEAVHFESTPLTSIESAQKVVDLVKVLTRFAPNLSIKTHMIPFHDLHQVIMEYVPKAYHITIMRRMMVRICEKIAEQEHVPVIINGESIGQVASQTLDSMYVVEQATRMPILRPLITMDKKSVVEIAERLGTYSISIRPFEDCCAIYVPKQPALSPRDYYAKRYERLFDYEHFIEKACQNIKTLTISKETPINLPKFGLTVAQFFQEGEKND